MSKILSTLCENEDMKTFLAESDEILNEIGADVLGFGKVVKNFVLNNPLEFIDENVDETVKNVRVFTEAAISQYAVEKVYEASVIVAETAQTETVTETEKTSEIDEYI